MKTTRSRIIEALDLLKRGNFRCGEDMDAAHEICQAQEGSPLFDWVHALVHRIEGDDWNADYWYRRAGRDRHPGPVDEEWQIIRQEAEGSRPAQRGFQRKP